MHKVLLAILTVLSSAPVLADWQLDNQASSVSFISIKNATIAETHHFARLQGKVSAAGEAQVMIDLASVDTAIPIRDERMRDMLFSVADFSQATIRTPLNHTVLETLEQGVPRMLQMDFELSLHGNSKSMSAMVMIFRDQQDSLHVLTRQPVLLNAADFGLADGIEALREVAALGSIVTAVPVSFQLLFRQQ